MSGLFGGNEPAKVDPLPEPIVQADPEAASKALKVRRRLRAQSGSAANILTSGQGDQTEANTASAALLG